MRFLYLFSVWLHVLSAAVWIGGMVFVGAVMVPLIRRPDLSGVAPSLIRLTGSRFRAIGWVALSFLLFTGVFNAAYRGVEWDDLWAAAFWQSSFGLLLGHKLFFFLVIVLLSAWHDFFVGPRATSLWQSNPAAPEALRLRRRASWIGRANLLLALIVVALGVALVRGFP